MVIKLVRHGESLANVGLQSPQAIGDHRIALSPRGTEQARRAGQTIGHDYVASALIYSSPYERSRATLTGILEGAGVPRNRVSV